jgi:hypothetical protein
MNPARPFTTRELLASERRLLTVMRALGFGRLEYLQIHRGEPILDPGPTIVRDIKFGAQDGARPRTTSEDFELKQQVAEFFEYTRSVDVGEIRTLEVRHGLPFAMEVELPGGRHA